MIVSLVASTENLEVCDVSDLSICSSRLRSTHLYYVTGIEMDKIPSRPTADPCRQVGVVPLRPTCPHTFMTYPSKPGCPMCGIVNAASHSQINSPSFNPTPRSNKPNVVWKDENFTVYRETANPVSSIAHVIIAFKCVSSVSLRIPPP